MSSTRTVPPASALAACCSPVTGGIVDAGSAETLARMFKALSDPTRVRLLSMIATAPPEGACACDMTEPIGLSQPTISHHLKVLRNAGILDCERRGTWVYYRVVPSALHQLSAVLVDSEPLAVDQVGPVAEVSRLAEVSK